MSLRTFFVSLLVIVVACGLISAQAPKPPVPRWTRQELQAIDRIAHAYYESDTRSMLELLSRLAGRISNAKVESLNQELCNRKLPDAPTLLMESRLAYVQQGLAKQLPKPSPREALLVLRKLNEQVQRTLEATATHPYLHKCGTTREQILDDIRSGRATVNGASAASMAALQNELRAPTGVANAHAPSAPSSVAGGQASSGPPAPAVVPPTGGAAATAKK